jgi:[ribosomal protein S18]-alanine N-acetyltransferase
MTITLVDIRAADVERIMPVMHAAFDSAFGESWSAIQCAGILSLPGSRMVAALVDEFVVGFALWRVVLDESELMLIASDPKSQRTGIGLFLAKHAVAESKESGATQLHVEVRADNPALYFYAKLGFLQVGCRPQYYKRSDGGVADAITLSLGL